MMFYLLKYIVTINHPVCYRKYMGADQQRKNGNIEWGIADFFCAAKNLISQVSYVECRSIICSPFFSPLINSLTSSTNQFSTKPKIRKIKTWKEILIKMVVWFPKTVQSKWWENSEKRIRLDKRIFDWNQSSHSIAYKILNRAKN